MVNFLVGPDFEEFSVHGNRLNKTAFFDVHGYPKEAPQLEVPIPQTDSTEAGNASSNGHDNDNVKDEQDPSSVSDGEANTSETVIKKVDYQISARDTLAAKAMRIFVEALYNEEPGTIRDRESLKTALKAYQFARKYKHWVLQNHLLERFREHYMSHKIKMDELQWLVKMFGDDANATPLTRYILEQIAFEISARGINTFHAENGYFKFFLAEGDRQTRSALFSILARHAHDPRHPDPAQGKNEWRVVESGPTAGAWKPDPFSLQ